MRQTCCCTLFVVRHQFSHGRQFFFDEKILCFCRLDCYPDANCAYSVWQKTCLQNMANAFYTLFAIRRFFVVSPLFCCCSRIVYSGLEGEKWEATFKVTWRKRSKNNRLIYINRLFLPEKIDSIISLIWVNRLIDFF